MSKVENRKILLMISGGLDSVVLFDIINKEKYYDVFLFHCNYNFQINSNSAESFCRKLAKNNHCNIDVKKINISEKNFEANARKIRYKEAYNLANKYSINIILTAHHQDDQLETLYMKDKNGSDWISNIGIRDVYDKLRRPMLNIPKKDILLYAKNNSLKWVEDLSNNDVKIYRNYIRKKVIPNLKKNQSDYVNNLYLLRLKNKIKYDELKDRFLNNKNEYIVNYDSNYINIRNTIIEFNDLSEFKLYYQFVIKAFLKLKIKKSKSYWSSLYDFIKNSVSGSKFILNENYLILNDRDSHFVCENNYFESSLNNRKKIKLDLNLTKIYWSGHLFSIKNKMKDYKSVLIFPHELIKKGLYLRSWKKGDVCYSSFYDRNIKVSKIFINNKISIFDKIKYPIFVDSNDEIVIIPKLYDRFKNKRISKKIEFIWC